MFTNSFFSLLQLPIVCLANKIDDKHDKKVDFSKALSWAQKEKIRLYEVTSIDRKFVFSKHCLARVHLCMIYSATYYV